MSGSGKRFRDVVLLAMKMEEEATIQGIEVVLELGDTRRQALHYSFQKEYNLATVFLILKL